MPDEARADGDLLAASAAGDGAAFTVFYRRHLPAVVGLLVRETGDRETAADLAAEVFAAVFLSARRFRARGAGSAWPWVRGIAENKLRESRRRGRVQDRARRRLAFEPEVLDDEDLQRVDELAAADRSALRLVEDLPETQREAPGKTAFQSTTAEVARRGQSLSTLAETYNQHFAVAIDQQLITVPYIDFKVYPDGISAGNGAQLISGFTAQSARIVATLLRFGPLPASLELR